jgi:hypothetical protein
MSVISISPDLVEINTLLLQPSQLFSSSSVSGVSGEIKSSTKPSTSLKGVGSITSAEIFRESSDVTSDDDNLFEASQAYQSGTLDISSYINGYLGSVSGTNSARDQYRTASPARYTARGDILEIEYATFGTGEIVTVQKDRADWTNLQRRTVRNLLIPDQRTENSLSFYGYVNYHSLSFISSSNFGTASAIIYPNFSSSLGARDFSPASAFSLDFFIKPKCQIGDDDSYRAGTILHISSSICVSLVSGSQLGPDGKPDKFKILLQLSQSANLSPSQVDTTQLPLSSPNNLIFSTAEDLSRDSWHRVTIRWGGSDRSYGTGSIQVDGNTTHFNVNESSVFSGSQPEALIIGNYYDSGDRLGKFFNTVAAADYGTEVDPDSSTADPTGFTFSHPLNAEIHHLSLFDRYLSDADVQNINDQYFLTGTDDGPSFFVAPFFTSSVPEISTYVSPTRFSDEATDSPVSYHMALGYHSNYLNLQNFLVDFSTKKLPRAYGMSEGVAVTETFDARSGSVDNLMMLQTPNRRRNFTIIPCDDGNFEPNFNILLSDSTRFNQVDSATSSMFLSCESLAPEGTLAPSEAYTFSYDGSDIFLPLYQDFNYAPERLSVDSASASSFVDRSSPIVTIFSIPSIYFLRRIVPGTFTITDSNVSGSGGMLFTLKDDGRGNLYRSDCLTAPAKWNRVGAIFYSHGIVSVLTPHIPFFGKNQFEMSFRGEVRKHVLNVSVPAVPDVANLSFNSTYQAFPPTDLLTEQADDFSYITGINLHDQNLNVVMRARLAQPVQKREGDEFLFRLRYDF